MSDWHIGICWVYETSYRDSRLHCIEMAEQCDAIQMGWADISERL